MNNHPIGIFDSGMGGLSVWREIRKVLPNESLLFFGDGLRCPYGSKTKEVIRQYSEEAVEWMLRRGVKLVVVACNTATATAIEYLRERYPNEILIGMEPAVKPAALTTDTGIVAILATPASFEGELYKRTSARYGRGVEVIPVVGKGFVELVEANLEDTVEAYKTVKEVIDPLIDRGVDKLVLGCTHYPFLVHQIERVIEESGKKVDVIDPAPAIARHVANVLKKQQIEADPDNRPILQFHTLADASYLQQLKKKSRLAEIENK